MRECPVCHTRPIGVLRLAWSGRCPSCSADLTTIARRVDFFLGYVIAIVFTPRGLPLLQHMAWFVSIGIPVALALHLAASAWLPLRASERTKPWREHSSGEKYAVVLLLLVALAAVAYAAVVRFEQAPAAGVMVALG